MAGKGLFVTATDTGVGKTHVSAAILRAMRLKGIKCVGIKPVETGCDDATAPPDGLALREAAHSTEALNHIVPYAFREPAAPLVAAEAEAVRIDPAALIERVRAVAARHEFALVEGAGGLMVPIAERFMMIDLAAALGYPVLVVTHPYLGTINHTLLTIGAIVGRGLKVAGIVINRPRPGEDTLAERTAREMIVRFAGAPVLADLPHGAVPHDAMNELLAHMEA